MALRMERALKVLAILALATAVVLASHPAVAGSKSFALVVTNNRSSTLALPDLRYADDDGARYYRLFRSIAEEKNVVLLTTFDRATAAAYPDLVGTARAPTRAAVEQAVAQLAAAVRTAQQNGDKTTFYFVYAGHGEVENGRGYIDLEDGRLDGQFIENVIIERLPADTKHILLDSCNSFFVMNPRKPGGRRWATPKDMALGFAKRYPEVGLFLSTNSDAEVFEWSELESGVFSHEVRSGLSGAADVDGDGKVSYSELAGFVNQANAGIVRESLRPHIYQRGPNGDSSAALFAPSQATGRRLALPDEATRLWIKSDTGERLLDLHKEKGPMTVVLPAPANQGVSIYVERPAATQADRPMVAEHDAPAGEDDIRLAEVSSSKPAALARGDRLFSSLFATPYGPVAYRSFLAASSAEAEQVYGVNNRDVSTMYKYMFEMADADRKLRLVGGGLLLGIGVTNAVWILTSYADSPRWAGVGGKGALVFDGTLDAVCLGLGAWILARRTSGETVLETFEKELANGKNEPAAFARTEQSLENLANSDRRYRNIMFGAFETLGAINVVTMTVILVHPFAGVKKPQPSQAAATYASGALLMGLGFAVRWMELPTERLLRLYRADPVLKIQPSLMPLPGGGMVGLSATF
jgi:hypothetical protein